MNCDNVFLFLKWTYIHLSIYITFKIEQNGRYFRRRYFNVYFFEHFDDTRDKDVQRK